MPKQVILAMTVFLLTAYPPIASLVIRGAEASRQSLAIDGLPTLVQATVMHGTSIIGAKAVDVALTHFAGDAFYYFTVAHRSIGKPFYTYDGIYPTNGFHPLWQYVLTNAFSQLNSNHDSEILFVFGFNIVAVAAGAAFFSLALYRLFSSHSLAIVGAVPGVYALILPPVYAQHATWGLINGMESSLSILLFGVLAYLLLGRDLPRRQLYVWEILIVSTLLTLLTLTRLDDDFLFIPFFVLLFFLSLDLSKTELLRRLALASAPPVLIIGAYLVNNVRYAGLLLPASGQLKLASAFWENISILLGVFAPVSQAIYSTGPREWQSLSWRVLQIVVPAGISLSWLMRSRSNIRDALRIQPLAGRTRNVYYQPLVLAAFAAYVIIKAVFSFAAVSLWSQGNWYFPLSLMLTSLFALALIRGIDAIKRVNVVIACLFVVLLANFAMDERNATRFDRRISFWHEREAISHDLLIRYDGKGLVEFADGIIGYALSIPTMGGLGFTLDKEAIQAKQRGGLLDLAYRRGFRAFASLAYFTLPESDDLDPARVQRAAESFFVLAGQRPERWNFHVIYRDPASRAVFVAFSPK